MILILSLTAPSVIIYDNGCNLHQYILNREPVHFKSSWLLVDRFHWPNHTGNLMMYRHATFREEISSIL